MRHEQNDDFFVILIDWRTPGMDGVATTKAIRAMIGDKLPIIIASAYDWSDIEEEAKAAGVNAFVNKPIFKSRMTYVFKNLNSKELKEESQNLQNPLNQYREEYFTGKHGLLVEDNEINAEIAMEILRMTGMEIDHVWNGKEAVELLDSTDDGMYDIVFMDIQMPIMDGFEAAAAIRASEREYLKNIPIIALSANAFAEDVQRSREVGMNQHIAKPLDLNQLLAAMVGLLSGEGGL